jgi:hypothetical protein
VPYHSDCRRSLWHRHPRVETDQKRGKKVQGDYELVFMKEERGRQQWLLFKPKAVHEKL